MPQVTDNQPRRWYSCQEAHEDSGLVLSNRAPAAVRELYDEHQRQCRDCRRMHRSLYSLYEGPMVPPALAGAREEREFHAILRRMKSERPEPWYQRWAVGLGVCGLAAAAGVLTLSLFDVAPDMLSLPPDEEYARAPITSHASQGDAPGTEAAGSTGGIEHPAQAYGRVVGGEAGIFPPGEQASNQNTFPVGTRFELGADHSLQIGMVGKIVANFTPNSVVEWSAASPTLLEVELERGILAVRYDRRPSDPILQVRTPTAVVRVVGTVFTVQVEESNNTIVSVLRGQVEVLHPATNRALAEVESGYRFDVAKSTWDDVGRAEVAAALPLSNDPGEGGTVENPQVLALADGHIPASWNVPGLTQDPRYRRLDYVPARFGPPSAHVGGARSRPQRDPSASAPRRDVVEDEGEDVLQRLVRDAEMTRRKELRAALESCRALYDAHATRYLAAKCVSTFIEKYGDDPLAVEGYLLVGMLRMDFGLDYEAAEVAFQTFLRRAPNHPSAEFALYRMWLASTEDGRISQALERGRKYLVRYPNGKYVGKVLQRFPELKSAL